MFKFALKNMAIKKTKIILIVISIVISASVAILAYNISEQVDDGFKTTAGYYDMIIGPSGSGKSTLLRCMNLPEQPTYGEIWLDDQLLTDAAAGDAMFDPEFADGWIGM